VLPFTLTEHQERAITEIDLDLAQTTPMQRLLQGDVGSGKTVVALYALLRAVENQRQGALMAPTETLAEQHFLTLEPLCAQLGVRCVLLTGSVGSKKIRDEIANGVAQIAVGTHALIQRDIEFLRDRSMLIVLDNALRHTPAGIVWGGREHPAARVPLRSTDADSFSIVDGSTGAVSLGYGAAAVDDPELALDLAFTEGAGRGDRLRQRRGLRLNA